MAHFLAKPQGRWCFGALGVLLVVLAGLLAFGMIVPPVEASGVKLTHAQAAGRLRAAGITWSSSGNCSNRHNRTCTSFDQINSGTIDGIITLKRASGCAIHITGGTETGHASGTYSHWNGYKVDIRFSPCIDNYIYRNFRYIGLRGDGARMYRSAAGNIYAREGNHWDILYY